MISIEGRVELLRILPLMIIIRERAAKQKGPTSFLRAKLGECGLAGIFLGYIVFRWAKRKSFRSVYTLPQVQCSAPCHLIYKKIL